MNDRFITIEFVSMSFNEAFPVEWIEVRSITGNFIIAPGHAPLIAILKKNSNLSYKRSGHEEVESRLISSGIIFIEQIKATVVID